MKQFTSLQLALVYAGCFLGAGYISGQEMWQFFGVFGINGLWGLILCTMLQFLFCVILFSLVRRSGHDEIERVVVRRERRRLRTLIGVAQLLLLFGVTMIMSAGAGALMAQMSGGGAISASLIFCTAVALFALRGIRGMVAVFSGVVPVLVVATLAIALWAGVHFGWEGRLLTAATHGAGSPLLSHWAIAAVSFVSYNLFSSIAILVPLAREVSCARVVRHGAVLGALCLLVVACAILLSLYLLPDITGQELPMLALAQQLHPAAGWMFAGLLFAAMFGTALSCTVAAQGYLAQKFAVCEAYPVAAILPFTVCSFLGGLFGFGELIGWIYPIFGYFGFAVLCSIVAHERYMRKHKP